MLTKDFILELSNICYINNIGPNDNIRVILETGEAGYCLRPDLSGEHEGGNNVIYTSPYQVVKNNNIFVTFSKFISMIKKYYIFKNTHLIISSIYRDAFDLYTKNNNISFDVNVIYEDNCYNIYLYPTDFKQEFSKKKINRQLSNIFDF